MPHTITNSCIVTAVWHSPVNISREEIQSYQIFINDVIVSRNPIISNGTSNDSLIIATVVYVPGCVTHHTITVREVDICGRIGNKSEPYRIEECPCAGGAGTTTEVTRTEVTRTEGTPGGGSNAKSNVDYLKRV